MSKVDNVFIAKLNPAQRIEKMPLNVQQSDFWSLRTVCFITSVFNTLK